jgi:predicted ATPase/DNA-binding winged helix-turn-helix (wHTH) protein
MPRQYAEAPATAEMARAVRYRFGRFDLQPMERRLLCAGTDVRVNSRAFDLMVALVERAGELVSKDALLVRVWPKLVVEDSNLHVHVSALRKVLGSAAIETVPGHGYRFTLKVAADDAQPSPISSRRHNVPSRLTSFVGHENDLARCAQSLETNRLLTVTGAGGLGKTRLSLELADDLLSAFADGIWLVELAPLSDGRLVTQAVASALGIVEQAGTSLLDTVLKYASGRRMLIILDNCEHLRRACAQFVQKLLQAGPHVKVLASSRERLHVPGETIFVLDPLAVPDRRQAIALGAFADYEAVRLFVDRATEAHPAFKLTKANAGAVGNICARLDGIPLALELAAARVRVVGVDAIAQRLDDRFRLLKGGGPNALPRQQTLRAAIDWSYDLLTEPERLVFQRLGVFSGGWTLEAAEAVCGAGGIDPSDVLELNGQLIEKSLVVMNAEGTRYRMLETVRQYAQERLDASGEGDAVRVRHPAFYLAFVEKGFDSHDSGEWAWYARLDADRENLRAAYDHFRRADGSPEAVRLVSAISFWLCREQFELGVPILGDLLARLEVERRDPIRRRGLFAAGFISYHKGRYKDARCYLEDCLAIARETLDFEMQARALTVLGMGCLGLGDYASARRGLVEALPLARELADRLPEVDALNTLAELDSIEGDLAAAESRYQEALDVARKADLYHFTNVILINLTRIVLSRGATLRAEELLRAALVHCEAIGSTLNAHGLLAMAGAIAALRKDWKHAAQFFGASDFQLETFGLRREAADAAMLTPLMAQTRESLDPATFSTSEAEGRAQSVEDALAAARAWIEERI